LPKTGKTVDLRLGVVNLVTTSEGERFENPRYFEKSEKKISRLSRGLSRKPKGSRNREKARIKLARASEKVANQRSDSLNKLSSTLVREYDTIRVRNVRPAAYMKDRRFAKKAADAGLGSLLERLRYKCDWYGKELIITDGSSQVPKPVLISARIAVSETPRPAS
jgi:putative transposase